MLRIFKQIKTIIFSSFFGACASFVSASAPTAPAVPFVRTAHGLTLSCPKIQVGQDTLSNMKTIIAKVDNNTLTRNDAILWSLIPGLSSIVDECGCPNYNRSNGLRGVFEDQLTNVASTSFPKDEKMQYLNYGSSLMFQDLMIVTKLALAGHTKISMVLVDAYYEDFFKALPLSQNSLRSFYFPSQTDNNAINTNNALYYLAMYCSLLQNEFPDLSVSIKIFQTYEQALAALPAKSCQAMFYVDVNSIEGMSLDEIESNSILRQGTPLFSSPYNKDNKTKGYVLNDYFKLASALLANGGCNCALTQFNRANQFITTPVFGQYLRLDKDLCFNVFGYLTFNRTKAGKDLCFNDFVYLAFNRTEAGKVHVVMNDRFNFSKDEKTGGIIMRDACNPSAPSPEFITKHPLLHSLLDNKRYVDASDKNKNSLKEFMACWNMLEFSKHFCRIKKD